jgi:hypothetical protein
LEFGQSAITLIKYQGHRFFLSLFLHHNLEILRVKIELEGESTAGLAAF